MPDQTSPRPRPGVSPDKIVAVAADLDDAHGLDALTMAAIARHLHISVPGLYKHVGSLEDVRRAVALLGITELTAAITASAVGLAGPDAVFAAANAFRAYAHAHPGRYAASIVAPPAGDAAYTEISDRAVRTIFAIFAAWSLEHELAIDAVRSFRAILHGFVSLEDAGGYGLPQSVDTTFARLVHGFVLMLDDWSRSG
ncbi:MAG: TetR/AcrR family transcriptional regulator [Thermomicrobiales bacterium]